MAHKWRLSSLFLSVIFLFSTLLGVMPVHANSDDYIQYDQVYKTPSFIKELWEKPQNLNLDQAVFTYIQDKKSLFGITGQIKDHFRIIRKNVDEVGHSHYRLQEVYQGVPIYGAEQTIHFNKKGNITSYLGKVIPQDKVNKIQTNPQVTQQKADQIAKTDLEKGLGQKIHKLTPKTKLFIYPHNGTFSLAYQVKLSTAEPLPGFWHYIIDAHTGKIIERYNAIQHATGKGKGVLGDTKTFEVTQQGDSYKMIDSTRGKGIETYDGQNYPYYFPTMPGKMITSNSDTFDEPAGVDAHAYAGQVFDYFKEKFKRNGLDNQGMKIISSVHVGKNWNNAAWNGEQIFYGDGDGELFIPLSGSLDVVAHELTHAVTTHTADLEYKDESGALNESMSDIFAVMLDPEDWLIGEDVYTPNQEGDALRSLKDPTAYGDPDHYSKRYQGPEDNGGVHTNSGINNKAAYLLIDGGTHHGINVKGVGHDKGAKIYYQALTNYLTTTSNFADMRNAAIQSATDLFGANSQEVQSVKDAYQAIGVE